MAVEQESEGGLAQAEKLAAARQCSQVFRGAAVKDRPRGAGVDRQNLEHRSAPLIPGGAAARTAVANADGPAADSARRQRFRLAGRDRGGSGAASANGADEPLGDHADERRADQEARHPEVGEPGDRSGSIVRVQRREDEVSGKRRLYGHFRGFGIPDLAHHEDVRILSEDAANGVGKREADAGVHLYLAERRQDQFHGILDRHHVHFGRRDVAEHGIERGGLAAAGGAGDQNQPFAAAQHLAEKPLFVRRQLQLLERRNQGRRIEHPQHRLFAEHGRQGGNPQLDFLVRLDPFDPAVLWPALLCDVEPAEHLEAADDCLVHDPGKGVHRPQDPVNPEAHDGLVPFGFEVNVRGALLERLVEDAVECGYDGPGGRLQVAGGLGCGDKFLVCRGRVGVPAALVGQLRFRGAQRRPQVVEASVDPFNVGAGRDHDLHPDAQVPFEVGDGPAVEGIGDRHGQDIRLPREGADGVPPGERRGQGAGDHFRVEFQRVDRPEREPGVQRDGLRDVLFRKEPLAHQGRLLV